MKLKKFQQQKGITLIALVVTIIVLIILAGISINLILGENGIITKAGQAKQATIIAQLKEEAEMVKLAGITGATSGTTGEYGKSELLQDLNNHFTGSTLSSDRVTTQDGKYDIIVDDDLNIEVVEHGTIKQEARKIIITSSVEQREGIEYIDLTFEVEGMAPFEEYYYDYIDNYMYPGKGTEELEIMYEEIVEERLGEDLTITDEIREEILNMGPEYFGTKTYEQSLKMTILLYGQQANNLEQALGLTNIKINILASYYYICDCLYEEKYDNATDIENQMLKLMKYEGDFETMMGTTRENLQYEASQMGFTYEEYLKYIIGFQGANANVKVSNGDSFESSIIPIERLGINNTYSYEITQDGEYIFNAETMVAKGQTTVKVGTGPVTNPYGENDWEIAYVYSNGAWSGKIEKGQTIEGDIVAKLYKTGNQITPVETEELSGVPFEEGSEYKMVIEGTGAMGTLYDGAGSTFAWQKDSWLGAYIENLATSELLSAYITEVYVCDGITNIPDSAFYFAISLKNIQISNTVESIGSNAFNYCVSLENVIIPRGVTSIGANSFEDCQSITEMTIPNGVTNIGTSAFNGCTNLANISVPYTVTSIGNGAFSRCSITEITIPSGITSIGDATFSGCTNLINITIPEGVTSIGSSAFNGCKNLENIVIPNTVTSIGESAFASCTNLTNITIPSGITTIEKNVFDGCTSLENITIPGAVTEIGNYAFRNCTALTEIIIPSGVTSIGQSAFEDCTNLSNVYFKQTTAPTFGIYCFKKESGVITTFYFKNDDVYGALKESYLHYDATYGVKSTDYTWVK